MNSDNRSKKILYVVGGLGLGGIERLVSDLSLTLKQISGWEPVICCLGQKDGAFLPILEQNGIQVFEAPLERGKVLSFIRPFSELVRKVQPSIIHSHVDYSIPWQILGSRLAGVRRIIFTQHSDYQYWKTHLTARLRIFFYLRMAWPFISSYTAVSEEVQRSVADLAKLPTHEFLVIHNPVDLERFKPETSRRINARLEWGYSEEKFVLGTVGRLAQPKDHSTFLKVLSLLTSLDPDIRGVIYGEGPLRADLESRIRELSLQDKVLMPGKKINIEEYYPGFDCYLSTSSREGFPLTIIEAMACQLPVIATNVGGIREAIDDNCGILLPDSNAQSAADAVMRVRKDPALAYEMGVQARQRAIHLFSLQAITNQYIDLYNKLIIE